MTAVHNPSIFVFLVFGFCGVLTCSNGWSRIGHVTVKSSMGRPHSLLWDMVKVQCHYHNESGISYRWVHLIPCHILFLFVLCHSRKLGCNSPSLTLFLSGACHCLPHTVVGLGYLIKTALHSEAVFMKTNEKGKNKKRQGEEEKNFITVLEKAGIV